MTEQEELQTLLTVLLEWANEAGAILFMDEEFGDYHSVMKHLRNDGEMVNLQYILLPAIIANVGHIQTGEIAVSNYPPHGISREELLTNLFIDIEEWADTNLKLVDKDYNSAKVALLCIDNHDTDYCDDESIPSLQHIITRIRLMVDDYFSGGRDPGARWFVSFRDLSQDERDWLEGVNDRIACGEKRFLTQPETDRVGSLIAYDSPGTLADLLRPAWT